MSDIAWADQPPEPQPYQVYRYLPLKTGEHIQGVVVTELVGVWTHWNGRTVPCRRLHETDPIELCSLCRGTAERRWTGYIGLATGGGARRIVIVPATTVRDAREALQVGNVVILKRHNARAPLRIEVLRQLSDPGPVEDLRAALAWMWRRFLCQAPGSTPTSDSSSSVPQVALKHIGTDPEKANGHITVKAKRARRWFGRDPQSG